MTLIQVIEALLFSAQKPLTTTELRDVLTGAGDNDELVPNDFARVKEAAIGQPIPKKTTTEVAKVRISFFISAASFDLSASAIRACGASAMA